MRKAVVDASVAVKWLLREEHSDAARRLLEEEAELHAPSHWRAEVATVLWAKSAVRGVMTREQATARIEWFSELPAEEMPVRSLLRSAAGIAFDLHMTVHDALYLALAATVGAPLVTADQRMRDKAAAEPRFANLIVWVGDLGAR